MPILASGEVLIRVIAAGVNRADVLQREGKYPAPEGAPEWPGLEVSGIVADAGDGSSSWAVGDRVCALLAGGGYAEFCAVNAGLVLPVPDSVSLLDAGGIVEAAATVHSNLVTAGARAGETLLIQGGTGGIGTMAIQVGKAMGMTVVVTGSGPARLAACVELGADVAIDYSIDDVAARVQQSVGGVDVILDVMGASHLAAHLEMLNDDGRLVVIGMQGGAKGDLNLGVLLSKRLRVIGTTLRARPLAQKATIIEDLKRVVWPWFEDGSVRPVVAATFPLADAVDAHRAFEARAHVGKIVLVVSGDAS